MVWQDKFPFVDIGPSKTRIQFINEKGAEYLNVLVPDNVLAPDTCEAQRYRVPRDLFVERTTVKGLSRSDFKACLNLVEATSSNDYELSSSGWSKARKSKEMQLPDLRYILLRNSETRAIQGFMSFMLTFEDGYEVIYLYEIHLRHDVKGRGLGKRLMDTFEGAGSTAEVRKAMLTVFKANENALQFYKKLGYSEDDYSPRPRKLRNGIVKEPDYVILSKELSTSYDDSETRRLNKRAERLGTCNSTMPSRSKKRKAR